ncbi:1-(5-phosphoribosyl)-5-[(5-phosphoribosylamino)methylideneamino] imidazole-4-carboxamide isomerase [Aliiroseovarius crassostreae]|uniref:1-(5-phosphoribosyl)-5-[(5-phosphoribosylamino)methylideneamino] imidazole-4-carboxamide isomerase n=1 Tax=Aliiroseovarius crassostreae TaxID=154981 RepID=A0A0P7KNC9_9RHOB|nr:1-(5-phosphoribosyl)-5-[(5-phosphoribosylamino)methylideneamino] imidazole-4-carboxamide isomerase [Aliiroseovarius crassostreae]KPN63670.1 1-(5-phosphoribosyl)-5-[(5-phosphoribosylamino)methylideneamino] imidazole-4-carboxamide isomerase [Aliiroseovarius crassostreae]SFU73828.1 1-(5-phosphoribosyl)-5-[(5-phosphoribosylamino)methylideneamino] imidazole-4-carboxamide isomerase [Aliiroseovarius crassostreae]
MQIYPLIELLEGRCVSLYRGRTEEPQIWHVDPVKRAQEYAEAGAEAIQITDFDAMSGDYRNDEIIREIIRTVGIPVQVGGGFKTLERIAEWIDHGAARIIVGSLAVYQPDIVKEAARLHPDQIILAVDVFEGKVVSDGWKNQSAFDASSFLARFQGDPLAAILITDIDADIGDAEDTLALITQLASEANAPVIARGTINDIDDVSRLHYVPHVAGTIIGRALFDRSVDLAEALAVAKPEATAKAEFI